MKKNYKNLIKYRYAILIEVLIALAIMMVIMTMLLGFYSEIGRINQQQEIEQRKNFSKLYLSTRLAAVLPRAVSFSHPEGDSFFFTSYITENMAPGSEGVSLVFAFDNGVKLNPEFSNHVLGRLYINSSQQLALATWPSPTRWKEGGALPMQEEILYEGVSDLSFEFYVPPGGERSLILANSKRKFKASPHLQLDLEGQWRREWQQEWEELPVLVKVKLKLREDDTITLVYYLPQSHLFILYKS